jgi:hypothetical protein
VVQQKNLAGSNKEKLDEMIATFEKLRGENNDVKKLELK